MGGLGREETMGVFWFLCLERDIAIKKIDLGGFVPPHALLVPL